MTAPKCADCGKAGTRCIRRDPWGRVDLSLFLCTDCHYKREHGDFERAKPVPRERRPAKLQEETLF